MRYYCRTCKKRVATHLMCKNGNKPPSRCKACQRTLSHKHYLEHKHHYNTWNKRNRRIRVVENRRLLYMYLLVHPCIDCGEADPIVLEFDHRRPKIKYGNVGSLVAGGYAYSVILKEIAKCDVRCANCHNKRTAKQFNTWRYKLKTSTIPIK